MKTGLILGLILSVAGFQALAAGAYTSAALVTLRQDSGFSPFPQSSVVTIDTNGKVQKTVIMRRDGAVKKTEIAQLSSSAVEKIRNEINSLSSSKLVDPEEDQPRCTDAPSSAVSVLKGAGLGRELLVSQTSGCHTATVEGSDMLVNTINMFSDLAD